jgi:flap endonuclease-1
MGIRKLNKFLTDNNVLTSYKDLETFYKTKSNINNKPIIIAIDFWLYAHKFLHSNKSSNIILGFWNQITKLLKNNILPIYVIDGKAPVEKYDEIENRKNKKTKVQNKISILKQKINECQDENEKLIFIKEHDKLKKKIKFIPKNNLQDILSLIKLLGIQILNASGEADLLCAKLFIDGKITSCLSDDMDIIVMGCGSMIKFNNAKILEYNLDRIHNELSLSREQLIDISILFGCDYIKHSLKVPPSEIYSLIMKHDNLINILESDSHDILTINNPNIRVIGENYDNIVDYYINNNDEDYDEINEIINKIDSKKIINFFVNQDWFNVNKKSIATIKNQINFINHLNY